MIDIKTLIKGTATFVEYRDSELHYITESGWTFAIPISDTGTGIFKAQMKGITLMRWIRKSLEGLEAELKSTSGGN